MNKLQNNTDESPRLFYKHWAEMYKYTEMLRYNYANRLLQYEELLTQMYTTDDVPFPKAIVDDITKIPAYKNALLMARTVLKDTYHLNDSDVLAW